MSDDSGHRHARRDAANTHHASGHDAIEVGGRRYALTLATDLEADGVRLELDDVTGGGRETVADVLYRDSGPDPVAGTVMSLHTYGRAVPRVAIEHLVEQARLRLPPRVAVVVDPTYGERLAALAAGMPVWVADTPTNRAATERLRDAAGPGDVTTFRVAPGGGPAAWCAGVLNAVLDHHGRHGPHPRAGALVIVGVGPEPALVDALGVRGFRRVVATADGCRASVE